MVSGDQRGRLGLAFAFGRALVETSRVDRESEPASVHQTMVALVEPQSCGEEVKTDDLDVVAPGGIDGVRSPLDRDPMLGGTGTVVAPEIEGTVACVVVPFGWRIQGFQLAGQIEVVVGPVRTRTRCCPSSVWSRRVSKFCIGAQH